MKRIFSVLLSFVIIFLLSACNGVKVSPRMTDWGYFTFPNTDWGMTTQEVFKALGKAESDFSLSREASDSQNSVQSYSTECEIFGENAPVSFDFKMPIGGDALKLTSVKFAYTGTAESACNAIDKMLESQDVAVSDEWKTDEMKSESGNMTILTYEKHSIAKKSTVPQQIKDKYNATIRELYDSGKYDFPHLNSSDVDFTQKLDEPLASVKINAISRQENVIVILNGYAVAEIIEYGI